MKASETATRKDVKSNPAFGHPVFVFFFLNVQARAHLIQAAASKLDPIATEALSILEKKLMEDVSKDAAEVKGV